MLRREKRQEEVCVMSGGLVPDQAGGGRSFHRVIAPAGVGGRRCETALAWCSLGSQSQGSEVKPQLRPFFSCMCGFCPRNQKVNEGVFQAVPLTGGRGSGPWVLFPTAPQGWA